MSIQPPIIPQSFLSLTGNAPSKLEKVKIEYEKYRAGSYKGSLSALFNPSQLRYSKDVSWEIEPIVGTQAGAHFLAFQASRPQTLTLDLFLDSYEGDPDAPGNSAVVRGVRALIPDNPISGLVDKNPSATDIVKRVDDIDNLARVQVALHRPPRCKLWWGRYLLIRGVLTNVSEDYSMFMPNGMPVRATMSCTFTEAVDPKDAIELHSADLNKQRVVRRGETLSSIALDEYEDASQWRLIADANAGLIDNPRLLVPGTVLTIPPLPPSST
jgi:Contractile injection system tube protein/LysM domain